MKRLVLLLGIVGAALGLIAPVAASASTSVGHAPASVSAKHNPLNSLLYNTHYDAYQGGDGNGNFVDDGTYDRLDLINNGSVVSASSQYPFTPGSGMNATYDGDPIYVMYYTGSSNCVSMSGSWTVTGYGTGACGGSHWYSAWVKTQNAVDGQTGHSSWVNVGASNAAGHGMYLYADGLGVTDQVAPYGYSVESFIWTN
jgi:hypothetical protein